MNAIQLEEWKAIPDHVPAELVHTLGLTDGPKEVNFHRPRKPILAFSGGVHSCMGAHLARLEIKICISEFLRRIPEFRVKKGTTIEYMPGAVIGPKTVPLTW